VASNPMRQDKLIKYLRHARNFALEFSKDRSTKVGMSFLHPTDYTILTSGYNGQPRGADDDAPERHERPLKYEYTEHAERNGIFNLVRPLLRDSVVLTSEAPTMSIARAVISVGASEIWFPHVPEAGGQAQRAFALFAETGVRSGRYGPSGFEGLDDARHERKLRAYLGHLRSLRENLAKDPFAGATVFLARETYTLLAEGYSGLPRGANDDIQQRYEGSERLFWVEDSVRNAIYNKAQPYLAGSIAVVTETPCAECLRAIAAVGCRVVVTTEPEEGFRKRWHEQLLRTQAMREELGIELVQVPREALFASPGAT